MSGLNLVWQPAQLLCVCVGNKHTSRRPHCIALLAFKFFPKIPQHHVSGSIASSKGYSWLRLPPFLITGKTPSHQLEWGAGPPGFNLWLVFVFFSDNLSVSSILKIDPSDFSQCPCKKKDCCPCGHLSRTLVWILSYLSLQCSIPLDCH